MDNLTGRAGAVYWDDQEEYSQDTSDFDCITFEIITFLNLEQEST
jgi:hypothetical protein